MSAPTLAGYDEDHETATRGCQVVDTVWTAKVSILDELDRIRRRSAARACVNDVLNRVEIAKQLRSANRDERRSGLVEAREHLRSLGLASEWTDELLRRRWSE
jgi:hypothetical protein